MKDLDGKVALVTGSARGIGAAIARRLARDGAAVMINYSRSSDAAKGVADAIRAAGGKAAVAKADVGNPAEAQGLVERTVKDLGRLDIVVNNAAMISPAPFRSVEMDTVTAQFATNVFGPFAIVKQFLRHVPGEGGRVINISSLASEYVVPSTSVYSATKGASTGADARLGARARSAAGDGQRGVAGGGGDGRERPVPERRSEGHVRRSHSARSHGRTGRHCGCGRLLGVV